MGTSMFDLLQPEALVANSFVSGTEASELLSRSLVPYVAAALASLPGGDDPAHAEHAIQKAFVELDDRILDIAKKALAAGHPAGAFP